MTRTEILQRLQTIKDKGIQALKLLESKPLSVDTQAEIRSLVQWIKEELQNEYNRMLPKAHFAVEKLLRNCLALENRGQFAPDGILASLWRVTS